MIGSDEKVKKIKQTAFHFFLEIGYEATTIRMICKAIGIESPTLYYFFKSKKGLFLDIKNELEEEYRKQIIGLSLDNEKTPEDALKKYYKFCIQYAISNPDKTRFYLRHHLFRPVELKDEIEECIQNTTEEKRQLCAKYLKTCIASKNIDYSVDEMFEKYSNFIDNSTFNIIFSNWQPTEEEVNRAWHLFYNHYLKK